MLYRVVSGWSAFLNDFIILQEQLQYFDICFNILRFSHIFTDCKKEETRSCPLSAVLTISFSFCDILQSLPYLQLPAIQASCLSVPLPRCLPHPAS